MTVKIRQLDTTEPGFNDKLLAVLAFEASEDEAIDRSAAGILADVKALCRERAMGVLWATHLVDEAEAADRIVVMAAGKVRFDGKAADMMKLAGHTALIDAFLDLTRAEARP